MIVVKCAQCKRKIFKYQKIGKGRLWHYWKDRIIEDYSVRDGNEVKVWVPPSFRGVKNAREIIEVKKPTKLYEGIYSTGELEGIEQSLCVETEKGIVIIVGCSHPGMEHILQVASQFGKVYGIIGGLHGFREYDLFKDLELICPTHCTQHKAEIRSLYSKKYIEGGVGRIIEF